jgi:hypothetical protein
MKAGAARSVGLSWDMRASVASTRGGAKARLRGTARQLCSVQGEDVLAERV